MSALTQLMAAAVQKADNKPQDDDRAAKIEASRNMSERIAKLYEEYPDMTARELTQLFLGGLKGGVTGYKMIMEYLVKSARLLNVGVVNPGDIPLAKEVKAAAKAAAQAAEVKAEAKPAKKNGKK